MSSLLCLGMSTSITCVFVCSIGDNRILLIFLNVRSTIPVPLMILANEKQIDRLSL